MDLRKWIKTLDSRKAVALGIAFVLAVLNKVLDWGMETTDIMLLCAPLLAFAGIEGILDYAKAKNGSSGGIDRILANIADMLPAALKGEFGSPEDPSRPAVDETGGISLVDLSALSDEDLEKAISTIDVERIRVLDEIARRKKRPPGERPE